MVLDLVSERPAALGNSFHVTVDIEVWKGSDVLTVPSTALFRVGRDWAVFLIRGDGARLTPVTTGRSDRTRTVIERGLSAADVVVLQPSDALTDGSRVRAR